MAPHDVQETIAAVATATERYASDRDSARRFLYEAGFIGRDGKLAPPYADEEVDGAGSSFRRSRGRRPGREQHQGA